MRWWTRPLLFVASLICTVAIHAAERPHFTLAVVPQVSKLDLHRAWNPIAQYLSAELGADIELRLYDSIPEFELDFLGGQADLAYLNPYHALVASQTQGYIPLLRDQAHELSGVLVVRKDSPYQSVRDLANQVIAFPAPNSYAASLYMRALLSDNEHITYTTRYAGTHSNTLRQVLHGRAAAGGVALMLLAKQRPEIRDQLRLIYNTPNTPAHPLAAHPRVPLEVRQHVQAALIKLQNSEHGRALLSGIPMNKPVAVNFDRDYAPLAQLALDRYAAIPRF